MKAEIFQGATPTLRKGFYTAPIFQVERCFHMVARIKAEECVGCGACEDACPSGAIKVDEIAVVNGSDCVDCGSCADECPNSAIVVDK